MAQAAFDHWFNMLGDTSYADRCRRKQKLRQRKHPRGNYQMDEDVWARHPTHGIMYIASVITVNNYHRTCYVAFVEDGQTFNLPFSHLRHVTPEDIKHNRCVDYGCSWTERTSIGALNTYDRYGKLLNTQFNGSSKYVFDDFCTDEDNDCVNDDTIDDISLANNITEDEDHIHGSKDESTTEPIWVKIPHPEDPSVTFVKCPIWNASSYAEAKQMEQTQLHETPAKIEFQPIESTPQSSRDRTIAMLPLLLPILKEVDNSQLVKIFPDLDIQLIEEIRQLSSSTESNTPMDEPTSVLNEEPLLPHDREESEKSISSHHEENKLQLTKDLPDNNNQEIEYTCPALMVNDVQVDKSSQEVSEQQLLLDNTQDEKHQSSILIPDSNDRATIKDVGTQTEPSISIPTAKFGQTYKSIDMTYSNQPIKYVPTSTIRKNKRTYNWLSKYQLLEDISSTATSVIGKQHKLFSRFRVNNSFTCVFTKLLPFMIIYYLLIGSKISDKDVNSVTLTKLHNGSTDIIYESAIAISVVAILSFSSILNGPSRSLLELWSYPFAVP